MGSVNKVILVGRLGKDPEVNEVGNDNKLVAKFSVATSESWRDQRSGERKEKTEWHQVVVWNEGTAKFVEQYVRKGDQVYIEGQMQTRKYEKDGRDVYTTEVVVQAFGGSVQLLTSNDNDKGGGDRDNRDNDRGSDRGGSRSSGGGSSRDSGRDGGGRDSRKSSGSRDDDRGSSDRRGGSSRSSRDDDRDNDRGGSGSRRSSSRSNKDDMNDDIPF